MTEITDNIAVRGRGGLRRPLADAACRRRVGVALAGLVASVWLVHGLYNKLLHGSPRHLLIVQSVPGLGGDVGQYVLAFVGVAEVVLAAWVLSGRAPFACAAMQTVGLLSMNVVELTWARPHLLVPAGLVPINLVFLAVAWGAAILGRAGRAGAAEGVRGGGWGLYRLRRHPFPVEAHFRHCLVLTYAVPADVVEPLLPPGLGADVVDGRAFVAVAMVQTEGLRPRGLPAWAGRDFFLTGYRVFVRYRTPAGRTLRGLKILRSDADQRLMVTAGNLLTHYNYRAAAVDVAASAARLAVDVRTPAGEADLRVEADLADGAPLPAGSPFKDHRAARRFAGPLPYTFDYEAETHAIVAIRGERENWDPRPVAVRVDRNTFFDRPPFDRCRPTLAAAFYVGNIDYLWRRGVRYPLPAATAKEASC
jgi:hypothetical protein